MLCFFRIIVTKPSLKGDKERLECKQNFCVRYGENNSFSKGWSKKW